MTCVSVAQYQSSLIYIAPVTFPYARWSRLVSSHWIVKTPYSLGSSRFVLEDRPVCCLSCRLILCLACRVLSFSTASDEPMCTRRDCLTSWRLSAASRRSSRDYVEEMNSLRLCLLFPEGFHYFRRGQDAWAVVRKHWERAKEKTRQGRGIRTEEEKCAAITT